MREGLIRKGPFIVFKRGPDGKGAKLMEKNYTK